MARLMQLAQQGDSDAYRALLRACQDWLTAYFRRKLPPDEVGDMVQEVLLGLHAKRGSWSPTRPFLPWLAAIARYRWVDHLRSHYRRRTMDEPAPDIGSTLDADAMMARISLDQLVRQLPDGQATALRLVKIEGLSVAEASARSGQSESLIKVNIHRACKSLRALIEDA